MVAAGGPLLEGVDETWRTWLLLVLVRAAIATERLDEARDWAAELVRHAEAMALPAGAVRGACAQAELLLAPARPPRPGRVAMAAAERAGRIGARRDELAARLLAGRALAAAGDRTEAVALLRAVTVDAARGGAFMTRDAAARELRRLGSRVSVENRRAVGGEARGAHRARARRRAARRRGPAEQAGRRRALPEREDGRAPPLARLREVRRPFAGGAHRGLRPRGRRASLPLT